MRARTSYASDAVVSGNLSCKRMSSMHTYCNSKRCEPIHENVNLELAKLLDEITHLFMSVGSHINGFFMKKLRLIMNLD